MKITRIIFLVLPKVHLLDLAGPDQVFLEAKDYGTSIEVIYCGVREKIRSSANLGLDGLHSFENVEAAAGDYVIIPGCDVDFLLSDAVPREKKLFDWLRNAYASGAKICSICTGAFMLAKAGLLDNRHCTTHWKRTAQLKKLFPAIKLEEDILFTEDEGVFTSAGVTAGVDLALHILAALKDEQTAFNVSRELLVYTRRNGSDTQQSVFLQFRNHIHAGIHKVQDFIQTNIDSKVSLVLLADVAGMSARNLTRIFRKETGITINQFITLVRKEILQKHIGNPDISRKQLATRLGLRSERQVSRLLHQ